MIKTVDTDLGKKRFEVACYKNKILEWRSGVEKDIDNVLQIHSVFLNVSKGQTAAHKDVEKAFGTSMKEEDIILEILNNGEIQVGEKERNAEMERIKHEVIDIVASKLVNPTTNRPYTVGIIEKALEQLSSQGGHTEKVEKPQAGDNDVPAVKNTENGEDALSTQMNALQVKPTWTGVNTTKTAKSQALDAMKALISHQEILPVARARMRLRITCSTTILKQAVKFTQKSDEDADGSQKSGGTVKDNILGFIDEVESQDNDGDEWEVTGSTEPGNFRLVSDFCETQTKGKARIEVLDMTIIDEVDDL